MASIQVQHLTSAPPPLLSQCFHVWPFLLPPLSHLTSPSNMHVKEGSLQLPRVTLNLEGKSFLSSEDQQQNVP